MLDTIQAQSTIQSGEHGVKLNNGPGAPEGALRIPRRVDFEYASKSVELDRMNTRHP